MDAVGLTFPLPGCAAKQDSPHIDLVSVGLRLSQRAKAGRLTREGQLSKADVACTAEWSRVSAASC